MTVSRDQPLKRAEERQTVQETALALWFRRRVQSDFDDALTEPVPAELLRLIEARPVRR